LVEAVLASELEESESERIITRRIGDRNCGALKQHDIVQPELQASQRFRIGNRVERTARQDGEIGGDILEFAGIDVDPDSEDTIFAECDQVLARAGDGREYIVTAAPDRILRFAPDCAKQYQFLPGEIRRYHDAVVG